MPVLSGLLRSGAPGPLPLMAGFTGRGPRKKPSRSTYVGSRLVTPQQVVVPGLQGDIELPPDRAAALARGLLRQGPAQGVGPGVPIPEQARQQIIGGQLGAGATLQDARQRAAAALFPTPEVAAAHRAGLLDTKSALAEEHKRRDEAMADQAKAEEERRKEQKAQQEHLERMTKFHEGLIAEKQRQETQRQEESRRREGLIERQQAARKEARFRESERGIDFRLAQRRREREQDTALAEKALQQENLAAAWRAAGQSPERSLAFARAGKAPPADAGILREPEAPGPTQFERAEVAELARRMSYVDAPNPGIPQAALQAFIRANPTRRDATLAELEATGRGHMAAYLRALLQAGGRG